MRDIRVASVQFEPVPADKKSNLTKIRRFAEQAARQKIKLIAFPECCITGYWFLRKLARDDLRALAERVPEGPASQAIIALAKQHNMHRKIHCFISEHLCCGSDFTVFDTPQGCRVGVLTCYDNNIGENVRITALNGAEILLAPHQTGGCKTPSPHCMGRIDRSLWENRKENPTAIEAELKGPKGRAWLMTWLPARAHDNGLFLIFSNGVGVDDDEIRTGNAMILDPYGRVLAETCKADDDMVVADLDASLRENCTGVRWIKTRRPELYEPLTVRTGLERDIRSVRFGKQV